MGLSGIGFLEWGYKNQNHNTQKPQRVNRERTFEARHTDSLRQAPAPVGIGPKDPGLSRYVSDAVKNLGVEFVGTLGG